MPNGNGGISRTKVDADHPISLTMSGSFSGNRPFPQKVAWLIKRQHLLSARIIDVSAMTRYCAVVNPFTRTTGDDISELNRRASRLSGWPRLEDCCGAWRHRLSRIGVIHQ